MITTVTGKNQITIPAKLAKRLDIQPGTRIDWSIVEGEFLVAQPLPNRGQLARQAAGLGRDWLEEDNDPVAELIEERAQDDLEEDMA